MWSTVGIILVKYSSLWTNIQFFFFKSEAAVTVCPKLVSFSNRSHKNKLLNKFYFTVKYQDTLYLSFDVQEMIFLLCYHLNLGGQ